MAKTVLMLAVFSSSISSLEFFNLKEQIKGQFIILPERGAAKLIKNVQILFTFLAHQLLCEVVVHTSLILLKPSVSWQKHGNY